MGEAKRRKVMGRVPDRAPASKVEIPLASPDSHPVLVQVGFNPAMKRWDVHLIVGNFASEAEANAAGEFVIEMAKREFGVVDSEGVIS